MTTKNKTAPTETTAIAINDLLGDLPDFTDERFIDRSAKVPRLTALRGETDPNAFGLFVKIDDAAAVELEVPDGLEVIEYTYNNGETAYGYMFQKDFGMCIQPMSPLVAFRRQSAEGEQRVIEPYTPSKHSGNPDYSAGRIYNVLLTNGFGKLLHNQPLQLVLKGAASATFAKAWPEAVKQVTRLYFETKGQPYRPLTWEFNRLVVYYPTLGRELAGSAQKSMSLVFKEQQPIASLAGHLVADRTQYEIISVALLPPAKAEEQPLLLEAADDMPF